MALVALDPRSRIPITDTDRRAQSPVRHLYPARPCGEVRAVPNVVVTGSPERLTDITLALKLEGFDILAAEGEPAEVPAGLPLGSVDCYVQLTPTSPSPDGSALRQIRAVITDEVRQRFDTVARLGPLLAPHATVLLVLDPECESSWRSDALRRLVQVLADAIEVDHGRAGVRATVVTESLAAAEIANLARAGTAEAPPWSSYAELDPDLPYTEWRDQVFALSTPAR